MTILNETAELVKSGYTWGFGANSIIPLILGAIMLSFDIAIIINTDWHCKEALAIIFLSLLFIAIGLFEIVIGAHAKPIYKEIPQYEVILDQNVPFRLIYDNYEIIEQRGEIFVLRDKNWEDLN